MTTLHTLFTCECAPFQDVQKTLPTIPSPIPIEKVELCTAPPHPVRSRGEITYNQSLPREIHSTIGLKPSGGMLPNASRGNLRKTKPSKRPLRPWIHPILKRSIPSVNGTVHEKTAPHFSGAVRKTEGIRIRRWLSPCFGPSSLRREPKSKESRYERRLQEPKKKRGNPPENQSGRNQKLPV